MTQPPLAGLPPEAGKQADWLERDGGGQEVVSSCEGVKGGGRMWRAFSNRRGKRSAAGTRKWSCELGWISST